MSDRIRFLGSGSGHSIQSRQIGIFFEDINFSCDGGINANVVNNYSFDGVYFSNEEQRAVSDPLRYWEICGGSLESGAVDGLHENSRYALIRPAGEAKLINRGYNGGDAHRGEDAVSIGAAADYLFEAAVDVSGFDGEIRVSVADRADRLLTDETLLECPRETGFHMVSAKLKGQAEAYGHLRMVFCGTGVVRLDCVRFMNSDYWGKGDPKWRHGRLRRDLVQALADLKPAFMRFPGGCIVEGSIPDNEYNWKDTVGPLYERKSNFSLWGEKMPDGGYSQSYQIGFYEYFCLCEDLGMKPLPTLSVGLNCQLRALQKTPGYCTNIPVEDEAFGERIISNYIDLIEFANGDPADSRWAGLRADMGHSEPFGLDRIGIGNENFGQSYYERFAIIERAIHERYPEMLCVMCGGTHPNEDEVLGINGLREIYEKGRAFRNVCIDEHSYHSPQWFEEQESRYDNYDRKGCHVYVGEYAANGMLAQLEGIIEQLGEETLTGILTGRIQLPPQDPQSVKAEEEAAFALGVRPLNACNMLDTALGEAAFLIGLERNGDVVEMASYAPLFHLTDCGIWNHNLIDFNPKTVCLTANYYVQQMFSLYKGNKTIDINGRLPESVYLSVTEDEKKVYVKLVNTKAAARELTLETGRAYKGKKICLAHPDPHVRNELTFTGEAVYHIVPEETEIALAEQENITVPGYSVIVLVLLKGSCKTKAIDLVNEKD